MSPGEPSEEPAGARGVGARPEQSRRRAEDAVVLPEPPAHGGSAKGAEPAEGEEAAAVEAESGAAQRAQGPDRSGAAQSPRNVSPGVRHAESVSEDDGLGGEQAPLQGSAPPVEPPIGEPHASSSPSSSREASSDISGEATQVRRGASGKRASRQ